MGQEYALGLSAAVFCMCTVYVVLSLVFGKKDEENRLRNRIEGLTDRPRHTGIDAQASFSAISGLNRALQRQQFSQKLHQLLILSGWTMPVSIFLMLNCIWAGCCFFVIMLISENEIISGVCAFILAAIPYWFLVVKKRKFIDKFTLAFPDALMLLRSAIQAGQGIQPAFHMVAQEGPAPVAGEFQRVVQEVELGSHLNEALNEMYKRINTVDLRIFVLGVFIQHEVGGNLGELFQHVERTIRERLQMFQEIKVLSAQGKMTGLVLMLLPLVLIGVILLINPGYFDPLLEGELGKKLLWTSFVLQIIGCIVIRKMTSFKLA